MTAGEAGSGPALAMLSAPRKQRLGCRSPLLPALSQQRRPGLVPGLMMLLFAAWEESRRTWAGKARELPWLAQSDPGSALGCKRGPGWSRAPGISDQAAPWSFNVPGPVLFQGANPTKAKRRSWPGPQKSRTLTAGQTFWERSFVFTFLPSSFVDGVDKTAVGQLIMGKGSSDSRSR